MENRVVLITQARIGSSRLKAKVIKEIYGKSLLEIQLSRISHCKTVNQIVVAVPDGEDEKPIHDICTKLGYEYFKGSEKDVLERYYLTALEYNAYWVVRITSDCPLIDPELIDEIISKTISVDKDYGSNTLIESYPDGQDVEVIKFTALQVSRSRVELNSDKEHVTPFIKRNCETNKGSLYSSISIKSEIDFSKVRMTVDEIEDLDAISLLIQRFGFNSSWKVYTDYIINNLGEFPNQKILRNEGYFRSLKND